MSIQHPRADTTAPVSRKIWRIATREGTLVDGNRDVTAITARVGMRVHPAGPTSASAL